MTDVAVLDAIDFQNWLLDNMRPEPVCYWVGFLANDRAEVELEHGRRVRAPVHAIADLAWRERRHRDADSGYMVGSLCLTQRRLSDGVYEYWATKFDRPAALAKAA